MDTPRSPTLLVAELITSEQHQKMGQIISAAERSALANMASE